MLNLFIFAVHSNHIIQNLNLATVKIKLQSKPKDHKTDVI